MNKVKRIRCYDCVDRETDRNLQPCKDCMDSNIKKIYFRRKMKIYILIKDWIDVGHAVNGVGHAVLILDEKYKNDPVYQDWRKNHFRKVTCKVTEQEFEQAKQYDDFVVATEMAFDNQEIMLAFAPRKEWPKRFKYYRLYK